MKIGLLSANLGGFENPVPHVPQVMRDGSEVVSRLVTDADFPPRTKTMLPRLQMGAVKRFAWEWIPNCDVYVWVDSSVTLFRPDSVQWFVDTLGDANLALLPHPDRHSICEEAEFLRAKLAVGNSYLTSRYENERLDAQLEAVAVDGFVDAHLYASTAFAFRDSLPVREMFKDWWVHCTKYHALDQLSLPFVVWNHGMFVNHLSGHLYRHEHLTYTRKRRRK